MKKLALIILLFLPSVYAWDWDGHQAIASKVYLSFPDELQQKLDLNLIKLGSIAPDQLFKDQFDHHYPPTLNKSLYWINLTKYYLSKEDYQNASYSFGVFTHYISDSFASPHNVHKEKLKDHLAYERQASVPKTKCKKRDYNLQKELEKATESKEDWPVWLKTKDKSLPQKRTEEATGLVYAVALDVFNTTCKSEFDFKITKTFIISLIIGSIILIYLLKY